MLVAVHSPAAEEERHLQQGAVDSRAAAGIPQELAAVRSPAAVEEIHQRLGAVESRAAGGIPQGLAAARSPAAVTVGDTAFHNRAENKKNIKLHSIGYFTYVQMAKINNLLYSNRTLICLYFIYII